MDKETRDQIKEEAKMLRSILKAFANEESLSDEQDEFIKEHIMADVAYEVYGREGYNLDARHTGDQGRVYVYTDNAQQVCWYDYQSEIEAVQNIIAEVEISPDDTDLVWAYSDIINKSADWIINRIGNPKEYRPCI